MEFRYARLSSVRETGGDCNVKTMMNAVESLYQKMDTSGRKCRPTL